MASAPQETCRGEPDGRVVDEEQAEYVSSVGAAAGLPAHLHAAHAKLGGDPVFFLLDCRRRYSEVCDVKAPGFGENRKANLQDLAILLGLKS
uniref:Uncharacterized protein n=1 Tax=Arundo donax TaxID=35708 RepID=A0A0A9FH20_ARUDO